jgi:hypothetical protein
MDLKTKSSPTTIAVCRSTDETIRAAGGKPFIEQAAVA